jgi:KAP family P-loop domain
LQAPSLRLLVREFAWGVLGGSIAGALLPAGRTWIVNSFGQILGDVSARIPNFRASAFVAMLAILALIFPKFLRETAGLFRSWKAGLVRGTSLVWAVAAMFYWTERAHLLVWIVVGLAFHSCTEIVQTRRKREQYSATEIGSWVPHVSRSNLSAISFDKPIEKWDQDAIGRSEFVRTVLTHVLGDCEPALGVTADFGEGKSSILHLVRMSIEQGGKAIAVPFRTWLPGNEATFVDSLFATAMDAIREKYFLPLWRSPFKKYGRVVLGVFPKSWGFLGDFLSSDSQNTQINELTELFRKLPTRVVFLLDEIDRMHEEELSVLLKILRGAPELTNVCYICAFSKEALARVVSPSDPDFGSRYLDKFFPVQLQLPKIDDDLRESLFADRLSAVFEEEGLLTSDAERKRFDELRSELWYDALDKQLTNIRVLGQFIRAFQSSLHVSKGEVNAYDLLVIEAVRQLLPATYRFVYENGRYFHDPPKGIERWNRGISGLDEDARKARIQTALDSNFDGMKHSDLDLARSLLSRIFPSVRGYFRQISKGAVPFIADRAEERRISDPNFFPRYFSHTVPATMFGEREMAEFLSSIENAAGEEALHATVEKTWPAAERDDLRRIHFLRRLALKAPQISRQQAAWLAVDIAKRTSEMKSDDVVYLVIKGLTFALAARSQGSPNFQRVLAQVVKEAGSDRFASDIVNSSVSTGHLADEVTSWDGFDTDQIKKTFGQRMHLRYQMPVKEVFAQAPDDILAFIRWKFYVPEDAPYITEFFQSGLDYSIENLGVFILWLLPGTVSYQDGAIKFIESFYPVSEIVSRLEGAQEEKVHWRAEHAAAIERFWDFYNQESNSPNAPEPDVEQPGHQN